MPIETKLISNIIVCHGCKWLQAITIACSPQHKCRSSSDTCFVSFCFCELTLFNCFNFFWLSYVVLFPRRLSPKLPVLTLALADSSTSKQKTDTEPGIFILKSYSNLFKLVTCYMYILRFIALHGIYYVANFILFHLKMMTWNHRNVV